MLGFDLSKARLGDGVADKTCPRQVGKLGRLKKISPSEVPLKELWVFGTSPDRNHMTADRATLADLFWFPSEADDLEGLELGLHSAEKNSVSVQRTAY
jgi:hypothetical protein